MKNSTEDGTMTAAATRIVAKMNSKITDSEQRLQDAIASDPDSILVEVLTNVIISSRKVIEAASKN